MATGRTSTIALHAGDPAEIATVLTRDARRGEVMPTCLALSAARMEWRFDDRAFLAAIVGPACPPAILDRAAELMPRAPEPCLLRAAGLLDVARTETDLCIAIAQLATAARIDDGDPTPHALRVGAALALGAPAEGRAAFRDAMIRDPKNLYAHRMFIRLLGRRKHGSHTQALQAARAATEIAPRGSDLHGCLFEAHVEVWRAMRELEGDAADSYFDSDWVRAELDTAFDAWLDGPSYTPGLGSGPGLQAAAIWYFHTANGARLTHTRSLIRAIDPALRAA